MTAFDTGCRCDRCGAQALHRAYRAGVGELFLCNHHYVEFKEALLDNYWLIESDLTALTGSNTE